VISLFDFGGFVDKILAPFRWDIGVDLGSSNVLIYLRERGVVVDEPAMVARPKKKRWTGLSAPKLSNLRPIAFGTKAKEMVNREPIHIEVVNPIKNGIISDMESAEDMITYYLRLVYEIPSKYPKFLKPKVLVGVPGFVTDVQKRAVKTIFLAAGAAQVMLVEESILAAIGAGMPVNKSSGLLVVDIGGGKTEVSLVSMGGVVLTRASKVAGIELDNNIVNYVRMKYGVLIGPGTAERVKIESGRIFDGEGGSHSLVRGRDLESGLPRSIKLSASEIQEAVGLEVGKIVKMVKTVLDETPPELMDDILKRGIILVGSGAKLKGLDREIEKETKIVTRVTEDPGMSVIFGCGALIENRELLGQVRLVSGYRE
jgi:rod shape-determining protein MreB